LTNVYKTFNFEFRPNNLRINQSKDEIVNTIETHSITIIEGVTGCGKSTQVPQFILDNSYNQRKYCNIIGKFSKIKEIVCNYLLKQNF
jgi:ATP-dependent RNA helicase TDRD9